MIINPYLDVTLISVVTFVALVSGLFTVIPVISSIKGTGIGSVLLYRVTRDVIPTFSVDEENRNMLPAEDFEQEARGDKVTWTRKYEADLYCMGSTSAVISYILNPTANSTSGATGWATGK